MTKKTDKIQIDILNILIQLGLNTAIIRDTPKDQGPTDDMTD
ncbi:MULTISPECIES: hypothetical protein [unclassified Paenibacillus]|nr:MULTISPECIES: hypothetical protein [unclassified Paenibacillus]MBP1154014.1 hypothetical protein [Paenibacillus sp. PvP091]MBP1170601.1 hypothetical protein [Paenibacillus sp. PvR098]MBP2441629.1 hypothetical protein [Paenibacillus sp. PvP052]